jgi:hypothetical protein
VTKANEKLGWCGKFEIIVKNKETGEITEEIKFNRVMDNVLDKLVKTLQGDAPDLEIEYLALGTGNTAITDSDTTLDTEIFRTPYTLRDATLGTGIMEHTFVVLDTEAVATIEEIGIFGGSTATASADTGTLISRILWHKVKSNSEEIQFIRTDTIGRG